MNTVRKDLLEGEKVSERDGKANKCFAVKLPSAVGKSFLSWIVQM